MNGYLQSLLEYLRRQRPDTNASLFTALFLCLVTGERNLLVRTEEGDIADVAAAAMNILISIFGIRTQRVHARKHDNPDLFLKSIFLVPPPPSSAEHLRHSSYQSDSANRESLSPMGSNSQRPSTDIETASNTSKPTAVTPAYSRHRRRGSHLTSADNASISGIRPESGHGFPLDVFLRNTRTSNSNLSQYGHGEGPRGIAPPRVTSSSRHSAARTTLPKLPHALVLTKLERAGIATLSALAEALRTRVISVDSDRSDDAPGSRRERGNEPTEWNLPSGFFVVYVCGVGNGKDRPPLPSFMLDAFAFNVTVLLDAPVGRIPPALLRSTNPLVSITDIEELRSLANTRTYVSPHLDTYIMNLLFAARHHPHLEGTLLSARCTHDMEDFIRSACVLFNLPWTSPDFLRHDKNIDATVLQTEPYAVSSGNSAQNSVDELPAVYSCTEKDVGRVFAGVLAHRLSTCSPIEGPLRSMFFTAVDVLDPSGDANAILHKEDMTSVFSILAGILRFV